MLQGKLRCFMGKNKAHFISKSCERAIDFAYILTVFPDAHTSSVNK